MKSLMFLMALGIAVVGPGGCNDRSVPAAPETRWGALSSAHAAPQPVPAHGPASDPPLVPIPPSSPQPPSPPASVPR